jgi:hypothetical protein
VSNCPFPGQLDQPGTNNRFGYLRAAQRSAGTNNQLSGLGQDALANRTSNSSTADADWALENSVSDASNGNQPGPILKPIWLWPACHNLDPD